MISDFPKTLCLRLWKEVLRLSLVDSNSSKKGVETLNELLKTIKREINMPKSVYYKGDLGGIYSLLRLK